MTDHTKFKSAAKQAIKYRGTLLAEDANKHYGDVVTPETVLELACAHEQAMSFQPLFLDAAEQAVGAQRERDQFKAAFNEWAEKSDWARADTATEELGKHLADVIKMRFDQLKAENEALRNPWQSMEACPKHVDVLFHRKDAGVFAGIFTEADYFMTDAERDKGELSEDEQFGLDAWSYESTGVYRCDGDLVPTAWAPYPDEPVSKEAGE